MKQHLAEICNSIVLNGSVCQAFDYNTASKLAYFKGQPPSLKTDMGAACVYPNVTLWILNSGTTQPASFLSMTVTSLVCTGRS